MIAELGHFALILALLAAVVQGSLPMIGAARGNAAWMAVAQPAAVLQVVLVALSFAALTYVYVVSDFTVINVVENSHSAKPMLYKVTGVWGNHEGSMILWILILALFGSMVALFGSNLPPSLRARVLGVQAWIGIGFLLFTLLTSNPFLRVFPAPPDGRDLNPLLQDPGLAFHPPLLYAGYVGFSMAFSFAIAALIEGKLDAAWARWVRPWTLLAWAFLTAGIALGSWWAYYELGWGGWWFWDPVENVSFMPWLLGTALLHSAIVVEKRDALKVWTVLLAILTFSLSLMGTFIVRSGLLTSVHAFATDPERGFFILVLLLITIGGSLMLFALRAPVLKPGGLFSPVSREGGMVINNLLLAAGCATVFLGTLYPLFLEAVDGSKVSVGPPFFNATFVPLMVPLLFLMAFGPLMPWKRADLAGVLSRLKLAALGAVVAAGITLYMEQGGPILAVAAMGLAGWLFVASLVEWGDRIKLFRVPLGDSWRRARNLPRSSHGMTLAHSGMAIAAAGMIGASVWNLEEVRNLRPGESMEVAGYSYRLEGVAQLQGPNYLSDMATISVTRDGLPVAVLTPEKRLYPVQNMPTTEAGIHTTWVSDLYAVIGDSDGRGGWAVRIFHEPLVPWIWLGSLVMVLGGLVSLSDRRLRVGAPSRQAKAKAAPAGGHPAAAE
ncbi:heme lyase CcmF/NrfE family subunit [Pelagibius litoralis]|uniref:Heme lyase CcmF/NrfE family subunit n=1 Tax=Pelagibius litoralis TaxID=374515 RepID=A0A967KGJ8_9PROT|nr:heme lyase CcmF/NrfE family subunit [Pelagibius litoralis]NIA72225.1 heme lyase CcmF/NrfE family subunit [Pelagibius litoralis]